MNLFITNPINNRAPKISNKFIQHKIALLGNRESAPLDDYYFHRQAILTPGSVIEVPGEHVVFNDFYKEHMVAGEWMYLGCMPQDISKISALIIDCGTKMEFRENLVEFNMAIPQKCLLNNLTIQLVKDTATKQIHMESDLIHIYTEYRENNLCAEKDDKEGTKDKVLIGKDKYCRCRKDMSKAFIQYLGLFRFSFDKLIAENKVIFKKIETTDNSLYPSICKRLPTTLDCSPSLI